MAKSFFASRLGTEPIITPGPVVNCIGSGLCWRRNPLFSRMAQRLLVLAMRSDSKTK